MNKDLQSKNLDSLKSLYKEIQDKWSVINKSSPESNKDFWLDVSILRMMLKDFFQAFGTIDKREKVKHWHLLNELSLISVIVE